MRWHSTSTCGPLLTIWCSTDISSSSLPVQLLSRWVQSSLTLQAILMYTACTAETQGRCSGTAGQAGTQAAVACRYLKGLFALAHDPSTEVRKAVCTGLVQMLQLEPERLAPHMHDIIEYMLASTQACPCPSCTAPPPAAAPIVGQYPDSHASVSGCPLVCCKPQQDMACSLLLQSDLCSG